MGGGVKKNARHSRTLVTETTHIPVKGDKAHLGAIAYLAVLAYPERAEWPKRDKFVEAAKAWLCKQYMYRRERKRAATNILPKYRSFKWEKIDGTLKQAFYRIEAWRLPAAMMADWVILEGKRVGPFVIRVRDSDRKYFTPASLNRAAERVGELLASQRQLQHARRGKEFGWERTSVMHRVWASTKPVLHLALAFPSRKGKKIDPFRLVVDPSWLAQALVQAEATRLILPQLIPGFKIEKSIRLLPHR